jgi:hypothetical protein
MVQICLRKFILKGFMSLIPDITGMGLRRPILPVLRCSTCDAYNGLRSCIVTCVRRCCNPQRGWRLFIHDQQTPTATDLSPCMSLPCRVLMVSWAMPCVEWDCGRVYPLHLDICHTASCSVHWSFRLYLVLCFTHFLPSQRLIYRLCKGATSCVVATARYPILQHNRYKL